MKSLIFKYNCTPAKDFTIDNPVEEERIDSLLFVQQNDVFYLYSIISKTLLFTLLAILGMSGKYPCSIEK